MPHTLSLSLSKPHLQTLVVGRPKWKSADNSTTVHFLSLISRLCKARDLSQAFSLITQFESQSTPIQPHMYAPIFMACTGPASLKPGLQAHAHMTLRGLQPDSFVAAKLVAMYASSRDIIAARSVFDRVHEKTSLLYNSMLRGYATCGFPLENLQIYTQMHKSRSPPDNFTFPFLLKSCADLNWDFNGKCMHNHCLRAGLETDLYVGTSIIGMYAKCGDMSDATKLFDIMPVRDVSSWNALINGYMKCGDIDSATNLFHEMPEKNVVSWTSMVAGFTQNGLSDRAIDCFNAMRQLGPTPNWVTVMSVLPACGHSAALDQGNEIHEYANSIGLSGHPSVQTALVAMYGRCGSLDLAQEVFEKITLKDLVAWNTIITAYASHGHGHDTIFAFEEMCEHGVRPDEVTFIALLTACSHGGLVEKGQAYFELMAPAYGVRPRLEHYACMVDLLGRAGQLIKAKSLIETMDVEPGPCVWGSLLASCRVHRNLDIGELAAEKLFVLEPQNTGNYVLLSNIYADLGRWVEVNRLRVRLKELGLKKSPGCSWIEINKKVHGFVGGDKSHPQAQEIFTFLRGLPSKIMASGYSPDTSLVLHDVSEEEKEDSLASHSERLAIAFGILNTGPGTVLRVTKNLRVCGDCHMVAKFISKLYGRDIVLRDVSRFHHISQGICSCKDYW
ncbi:hypothetical protein AMTRI_Chr13g125790 [Amborella trichopoda]